MAGVTSRWWPLTLRFISYLHGSWLQGLSLVDGGNLQRFTILRDSAARHHDALLAEDLGDARIRKRRLGVLGAHELLDQRADGGRGRGAARFGGDVAAEEVFQFEGAARRRHELLRGDARDGALVQAEGAGDLAQDQRPHRDLTVLEEVALAVDDGLRHAQDRLEALLHVLDQPARLLQLRGDARPGTAARAGGDLRVQAVDPQARHGVGVEVGAPHVLALAHHHVGNHIARLDACERGAGTRVERLDQALRRAQRFLVGAGGALQPRVIATGEELEVLLGDLEREHVRGGIIAFARHAQLQAEAFAGRAGADAGGLEGLQMAQRDGEFFGLELGFGGEKRRDFFERLREVAVLVERVDQQLDQDAVSLAEVGERELRAQMVAQRCRFRGAEIAVTVLVVIACAAPVRRDVGRPVGLGRRRLGRRRGGAAAGDRGLRDRLPHAAAVFLVILALERGVLHQQPVDLLVELDRRELQQADRLLQLRREGEVLREAELKRGLHLGTNSRTPELQNYIRKFSPRYTRRTLSL